MSATKILWGEIAVAFRIILLTTWPSTQYVASRPALQAPLGAPWLSLLGLPIGSPLACFWRWYVSCAHAQNL